MRIPRISAVMRVAHNMFTNTMLSESMEAWVYRIHNDEDWTAAPDAHLQAALKREGVRLNDRDLQNEHWHMD